MRRQSRVTGRADAATVMAALKLRYAKHGLFVRIELDLDRDPPDDA